MREDSLIHELLGIPPIQIWAETALVSEPFELLVFLHSNDRPE
jgi:hypothetical protein